MNRRVCVWIGSILGVTLYCNGGGTATPARGQTPPPAGAAVPTAAVPAFVPPPVPAAIVAAQAVASADPTATLAINTAIKANVAALTGTNALAARGAKALLVNMCPHATQVTSWYSNAYSTALAAQVAPVLAHSTLTKRIEIGVVVTGVANNSQSAALVPAVQSLLADPDVSVAICGAKAAKPLVVSLAVAPNVPVLTTLASAVVKSFKDHQATDKYGSLAFYAYDAVAVSPSGVPGLGPKQALPLLQPLVDPVLDLLELRLKLFSIGLVPAPEAEANAPSLLSGSASAGLLTPKQTSRAEQDLMDLFDFGGQRAPFLMPGHDLTALRITIRNAAQALNVFAGAKLALPASALNAPGLAGPQINAITVAGFASASLAIPTLTKPPTLPPPTNLPPPPPTMAPKAGAAPAPPPAAGGVRP